MRPEEFLKRFALITEAPGGMKRLRELILQLAVSGRLVGGAPGDELRYQSISETMDLINGRAFKPSEWSTAGTPIIRIQNLNDERAQFNYCSFEVDKRFHVADNDLLISWSGTPGTSFGAFVWRRGPAILNQHIFRAVPKSKSLDVDYLRLAVNSRLSEMIARAQGGVGLKHITKGELESLMLPIPNLAEQRKTVRKFAELITLCDTIERAQEGQTLVRRQALDVLLGQLADAATAQEAASAWDRLRKHTESLITEPEDVAKVRTAILGLAVRGRLVGQDSSDKPAQQLIGETRDIGHETPSHLSRTRRTDIGTAVLRQELPKGWSWAAFSDVAVIASNLVDPKDYLDFPHLAPDNVEKGNGVLLPCSSVREDKVTSAKHHFFPGQIVYSKIRPNLAKVVIVDFEGLCSADMYPINSLINTKYLHCYMLSAPFIKQAVKTDTRIAMPKINQSELNSIAVPVPPLDEQRRIVAKVAELMAVCDTLEQRLRAQRTAMERFAEAAVRRVLGGAAGPAQPHATAPATNGAHPAPAGKRGRPRRTVLEQQEELF